MTDSASSTDMGRRRLMTAGATMLALTQTRSASSTPSQLAGVRTISVLDHGARGDGVTDDTAAFNRATRAAEPWSAALSAIILVPAGRYRIDGTVYVRKGQHLRGDGEPSVIDARYARQRTFVLGTGLVGEAAKPDPGGAPVQISDLQTFGGAPDQPVVFTEAQGFAIRRLFLSAAGTGIFVSGADGVVSDIVIDQALNGIVFEHCQNTVLSNLISYLANYAVTLKSGAADITISAAQICYSRHAAILLAEGATGITNVRISSSSFVTNEQYDTFVGYVHCRASGPDMAFDNCNFRNWPGYAIDQTAGKSARLSFANCQFDGRRTNPLYNASISSKVIVTGADGQFRFVECEFRHLHGEIVRVRPELGTLALAGGIIEACPLPRISVEGEIAPRVSARDVAGLATTNGAITTLPWWAGVHWETTLRLKNAGGAITWRGLVSGDGAGSATPTQSSGKAPAVKVVARIRPAEHAIVLEAAGANIAAIDIRTSV